MSADQTVEVVYESGADYPGLLGMWSLPPWPDADFHSLLVLSFASSTRAMATGDVHAHRCGSSCDKCRAPCKSLNLIRRTLIHPCNPVTDQSTLQPTSAPAVVSILCAVCAQNSQNISVCSGATLRDVTDTLDLVANERTLMCACLAERLLVQVMHKRMHLICMDAALAPDLGMPVQNS